MKSATSPDDKRLPPAQERRLLEQHLTGQSGGKSATYNALKRAGMFAATETGNVYVTPAGKAYCAKWHMQIPFRSH